MKPDDRSASHRGGSVREAPGGVLSCNSAEEGISLGAAKPALEQLPSCRASSRACGVPVMQPMPLHSVPCCVVVASSSLRRLFALAIGLVSLLLASSFARAADGGVITGAVSNTATGNMLEGARVQIPTLGITAL